MAPLVTIAWDDLINDFNSSSAAGNNAANAVVAYLTTAGFNYYNNEPALVRNTDFGSYELVSEVPLTVKYTINDGVVWSDGTPIDSADLVLAWATIFGFGQNAQGEYLFAHANPREALASKLPTVEGNSITFEYDLQYVDWELQFAVGVSAHGTVMMTYPEITDPAEAKTKLVDAIMTNDLEWLGPVAHVWNTGYQSPNTPGNSLVSLSSGQYVLEKLVEEQYATLVVNPEFNWGPMPKYERITVRLVEDSTAAVQAVDSGEVQIASGQPTADIMALVQGLVNADYAGGDESVYEHVDLTFDNGGPFDPATYGSDEDKARSIRQAFLLTLPRNEIVEKIIRPLNPSAEVRTSALFIPGSPGYDEAVQAYSAYLGTDEDNIAKAQASLAEAGVITPIEVGFWYPEGNVRRGQEFELIQLAASKAGFTVVDESEPNWEFTDLTIHSRNPHDAVVFGQQPIGHSEIGQFLSKGAAFNFSGYSNERVDVLLSELLTTPNANRQLELLHLIEGQLADDGASLSIYQFPTLTWWSKDVSGVSWSPNFPYIFWNFWDWTPTGP